MTADLARLDAAAIRAADTATLRRALADALRLTVSHLAYLAAVWAELEARGEDLSPLRAGIGRWLPQIAAGDVLAETVVNYVGQPELLRRVAALPVAEQRDIAEGRREPPPVRFRAPGRPSAILGRKEPELPGMPPRPAHPPRAGEPTDEDLDAACQPAKPQPPLQMLAAMLSHAGPRDAAELIVDAVRGTPDPKATARQLLGLLEQLVRAPEKRKLVV